MRILSAFNRREIEGCHRRALIFRPLVSSPTPASDWNPEVTLPCHLWGHFPCCPGLTPLRYSLLVPRSQVNLGERGRDVEGNGEIKNVVDQELVWGFLTSLS